MDQLEFEEAFLEDSDTYTAEPISGLHELIQQKAEQFDHAALQVAHWKEQRLFAETREHEHRLRMLRLSSELAELTSRIRDSD